MRAWKLVIAAVALAVLGSAWTAFASADLELVSGTDIILFDGTTTTCTSGGVGVLCSSFGASASLTGTGALNITATGFNGWSISNSTGSSNSPKCSGLTGPGCIATDDINATTTGATADLKVFFGSDGFSSEANLFVTETGSGIVNGTATAAGYAKSGSLSGFAFSSTAAPSLSGQIGSTLSLSAAGIAGPTGAVAPGAPFALAIANSFLGNAGAAYNVDTTITAAEPASISLLLVVLAGFGLLFLRRQAITL